MRRAWNHVLGPPGAGQRFAQALGCISTQPFVSSVIAINAGLLEGLDTKMVADRVKVDAEGNKLEDHTAPGDYLTVGYRFAVGEQEWEIERAQEWEGEQAATDYADALAVTADREFCESMAHLKSALDRFGGQCFIKPYLREGQTVGLSYHYEHLVRGQIQEPDAELPPPEPPEEAETPEKMHDEIEAEREAASA